MRRRNYSSLLVCHIVFGFLLFASPQANASVIIEKNSIVVNDSLDQLVQIGKEFSNKKDYSKAIEVFNQALKITADKGLSNDASFIYKNIGYIYYKQDQYGKAKEYYTKSIQSDSLSLNSADSYFNLALIYRKEKQSDNFLFNLYKSLQVYNGLENSKAKFSTYYKAGLLFKNRGDYDEAIRYLLKAYEGFEVYKDDKEKAKICNAIGATQRLMGNIDIAKQYYKESVKLREIVGDSIGLSYGYNNLGNVYKSEEKYDSARVFYEKAIRIQDGFKETKNLGKYYYNLGSVYYLQDDLDKAMRNYKTSIAIKKQEGDSLFLTTPYNELAKISVEKGNHYIAKQYLDSASATRNPNQSKDILLRHYEVRSEYYAAIGNDKEALAYYKQHTELYKRLFKEEQAEKIQELQERFENKKKLKKIQDLTQGNTIQKEIISEQEVDIKKRDWLLLLAFVLITLAIVVFFLIRQRHKTKEKGFEVHRLESIFEGQEVVKQKISTDLHDIVTTSFDAIRLKILALPKAKDSNTVSKAIVKDIADINKQIRLISHRLSPLGDKIKDSTLNEIIVDQLTEFQYYRKIFVDIQLPLPNEINYLTLSSQTNLYGIILEVLHNIEKHAQATEVRISHKKDGDILSFAIADNGIGFQNEDRNGIGLLNMQQRALLLRGECNINSSPDGTTITITFPIKVNTV
jgi:signal transduction histidine kinase/Flp pilus assembly protein TadD